MCSSKSPAAHMHRLVISLAALFMLAQVAAIAQPFSAEMAPRVLHPESPLATAAEPGASTHYEFVAESGHSYLLRVGQESVDARVTIRFENGDHRSYDSTPGGQDAEFVLISSPPTPKVYVSVTTKASAEAEVLHSVLLLDLGSEFSVQSSLVEAWHDLSTAIVRYWLDWQWLEASELADLAAEQFANAGATDFQADALLMQARALIETLFDVEDIESRMQAIAGLLDESYMLYGRGRNLPGLARVRYFEGLAYQNVGRDAQARTSYEEALEIYQTSGDWRQERNVHLNLAVMEIDADNLSQAIEALTKLQRLELEYNPGAAPRDRNFLATVLDQLGAAYQKAGDVDNALWTYFRAAEIHAEVGDEHGAADSLGGITSIYLQSGDLAGAESFLDQAEASARRSSNGRMLVALLASLGEMLYSQDDFPSAKAVQERVLSVASEPGPILAQRQIQLARTEIALGNFRSARDLADEALQHARSAAALKIEADALRQIGKSLSGLGEHRGSIERMKEALAIYDHLGLTIDQADSMHDLAVSLADFAESVRDAERQTMLFDEAEQWSGKSLDQVDWQLSKVSDPEMRGQFAASRRDYYQFHIRLLMDRYDSSGKTVTRFVRNALATSERARARMTMNLLNEASVELQQRVDPAIADQMRLLLGEIEVLERQRDALLANAGEGKSRQKDLERISKDIAEMRIRFDLHQVALRKNDNRYSALAAPEPSSVGEIQRLIDDDSVLLQYSLGKDVSIAWVVDGETINTVYLADRATIEAAAERAITKLRDGDFTQRARSEQSQAIEDIYRLVLAPVLSLIGEKRLIVVADGALHYLPFQTLLLPAATEADSGARNREVVSLPSMSVLAALRERQADNRSSRAVAVFADPVYETGDSRLSKPGSGRDGEGSRSGRLFEARSGAAESLHRISGTNAEAAAIARLVPADELLVETGFSVNRHSIVDRDLTDYRILHFATHGDVDRSNPALSSLRLSQFDENGNAIDGELRLHDVYRLRIAADLVVLSACETGLGTDIDGEGLIGLTQGFLYSGATSLIVSLWDVPDRPTAELMSLFYTYLLRDQMLPAAALVAAQASLAADRRWRDPYYWGAFVLLGDW